MTFYTWARIDWDLLKDDIDSVIGLLPCYIYGTAEEAKAAAESDWSEEQASESWATTLDPADVAIEPLVWKSQEDLAQGGVTIDNLWEATVNGEAITYTVYAVQLIEGAP